MREGRDTTPAGTPLLSDREWDCLCYVVERYSSKQIALRLGVSPKTVDSYLDTARVKLGARTRQEAAQLLVDHYGPISPRKAFPPGSRPGDNAPETPLTGLVAYEGAGRGQVIDGEPGGPDRTGAVPVEARQRVSDPLSGSGHMSGGRPADDRLGAAGASASQPGGARWRAGVLGNGSASGLGPDQSAGDVLSRPADPGLELDRRGASAAVSGLAALESLLDHHVPVAFTHPQPLLPGPRR